MTRWFGIPDTERIHLADLTLTPDAVGRLPILSQIFTTLSVECDKGEHVTTGKFRIYAVGSGIKVLSLDEDVHTFVTGSDA